MTQRIHSLVKSGAPRRTFKAREQVREEANVAPPRAMDHLWRAGYMSISLLTIVAAGAIACGEAANAELRFATVAIRPALPVQDICLEGGAPHDSPQACTSALARCTRDAAPNLPVKSSNYQRKSA